MEIFFIIGLIFLGVLSAFIFHSTKNFWVSFIPLLLLAGYNILVLGSTLFAGPDAWIGLGLAILTYIDLYALLFFAIGFIIPYLLLEKYG